MAKREFLMLAHKFSSKKHNPVGWYMSEKLDGIRCFWDGGISRDYELEDVPYANVEKKERLKEIPRATGLWSRNGNPIIAPDIWLDDLPKGIPLDGELWMGHGTFQKTSSVVKKLKPDVCEWKYVQYHTFGLPMPEVIFAPGVINNTNFHVSFDICTHLWNDFERDPDILVPAAFGSFNDSQILLKTLLASSFYISQVEQTFVTSKEQFEEKLKDVLFKGGEGLILAHPQLSWIPERTHKLLKVKPFKKTFGIVKGYVAGKETEKGSKLLGLIGSLICELPNGKTINVSGLTEDERLLLSDGRPLTQEEGLAIQGREIKGVVSPHFPLNKSIYIKYREETDDGSLKEAVYWRGNP